MALFSARLDHRIPRLSAGFRDLATNAKDRVVARSLNDGAAKGRTLAQRGIAASANLPGRYVSGKLTTRKANAASLTADVRARSRYSTIREHGMTELKCGGLSAAPWGVRRRYPRGFVASGKSGNRVPFQRTTTKRFPIKAIMGANPARELERDYNLGPVRTMMRETAKRRFADHAERAIAAALSKA